MARLQQWVALLGRLLLGLSFMGTGLAEIAGWDYALNQLKGTPLEAAIGQQMLPVYMTFAVLFEIGGGLMIIIGYKTRVAALFLSILIITVLAFLKPFWMESGSAFINSYYEYLKDTMILGALLLLMAFGAGSVSMDK